MTYLIVSIPTKGL